MVIDALAELLGGASWRSRYGAEYAAVTDGVILVKPQLFMNDSGGPLQSMMQYYRIPPERTLVVSDDLDQPFGKLRMRQAGGHGGHNGLRSIIAAAGEKFPRLRIGIGRGRDGDDDAVVRRVLGAFSAEERAVLPAIITAARDGAVLWQRSGLDPAMRLINTWTADPA